LKAAKILLTLYHPATDTYPLTFALDGEWLVVAGRIAIPTWRDPVLYFYRLDLETKEWKLWRRQQLNRVGQPFFDAIRMLALEGATLAISGVPNTNPLMIMEWSGTDWIVMSSFDTSDSGGGSYIQLDTEHNEAIVLDPTYNANQGTLLLR